MIQEIEKRIGLPFFWLLLAGAGAFVHITTAVLRLSTFFYPPRSVDFGGFYISSWAVRLGFSPYDYSSAFQSDLITRTHIPFTPPPIFNPPAWPFLLQFLTLFDFPAAAYLWLALNVALIGWISVVLADVAGIATLRAKWGLFLAVLTFGPVFLDLTLGQTSVVLLACGLAVGQGLWRSGFGAIALAATGGAIAVVAKLYPLVWLGAPFLLRRWRLATATLLLIIAGFGVVFVLAPAGSQTYWFDHLPNRIGAASADISVDDQALSAWLERLFRSQSFGTPGLSVSERISGGWNAPFDVDPVWLARLNYGLLAFMAAVVAWTVFRAGPAYGPAPFYLWILFLLLPFPHTERYNHVLLLPAMAWLWGEGARSKPYAVAAYFLAALARLTHLWVTVLPWPLAPLMTGTGVFAVLVLGIGIVRHLGRPPNPTTATDEHR